MSESGNAIRSLTLPVEEERTLSLRDPVWRDRKVGHSLRWQLCHVAQLTSRPVAWRRIVPREVICFSIAVSERARKLPLHDDLTSNQFQLRFSRLRAFPREVVAQTESRVALQLSCACQCLKTKRPAVI
jgi:hypothetical protein